MTEEEARLWITERFDSRVQGILGKYVALLIEESGGQNLVSRSTLSTIWGRHIVDSLQLLRLAPSPEGQWVDIGSGAGLPGMVIACASDWDVTMIEPRRLRANFLERCVAALGIARRARVLCSTAEKVVGLKSTVISARAVASLPKLFATCEHLSDVSTIWILPKGVSAQSEVESARATWQGNFHVEQSVADIASGIVVARKVMRR